MFNLEHGAEFPLFRGTPALDLDGKRVKGGVPYDCSAEVISADARGVGAVAVRVFPGQQIYIVELDDLLAADAACEALEGVIPRTQQGGVPASASQVDVTPRSKTRSAPALSDSEPWGPEPWGPKLTDWTEEELNTVLRQAGYYSPWWPSCRQWFVRVCVVWSVLTWLYLGLR